MRGAPDAFPTVWAAESETSGTSEASENSSQSDEAGSDGEEAGEASENSGDDEQENSEVQKSLDSEETSTTAESTQTGESEQPEETSDGGNTEETASTAVETEDTIESAVETETATETTSETETIEEESTAFLGDGEENPEEQVSIKLHFKDALNWDTDTNNINVAYASYKKPEQDGGNGSWVTNYDGGAWPGVEISQDADEYYTLELDKKPTDDGLVFVFHNGNGTQTNDFVIPMSAFSGDTTEYWIFAAKVGNYGKYPAQICSKAIDNFNSLEIGTDRRVTFRYFDCFETSTVKLAGDMTSWGDNAIEMKDENGSGIYIATTDVLEPKEYGYKFIIGTDKWITDPNNDSYTTNGNSKFTIEREELDKIISPEVDGNKVTFRYENKNATDVYVRGEMTDWSASDGYKMTKNEETGVHTLEVELTHGAYEYKFWYQTTENGEEKEVWLRDPKNELKTDTADPNSIVYVQRSEQYQYTIHYYNPSVDIPTQVPSEGSGPDLHIWDKCPGAAVGQEYKFTALTKDEDTEKGKTWLTTTVDVPFPHINIIARPTGTWIEGADEKEWTYEIKKDANTAELWFVYGEGLYDKNPFLETYRYTVHYYNPAAPNQETSTPDLYVWGAGSANPGKLYTFAAEKLDDTDNGIKWLTTEIDTPYEKIGLIGKPTAGNNAAGWIGKDTDRFYQLKNGAKEAELWYVHGVGIYEEKPMMKLDSVETALSLESMDYTQNSVLSLVFNGNNDSNKNGIGTSETKRCKALLNE